MLDCCTGLDGTIVAHDVLCECAFPTLMLGGLGARYLTVPRPHGLENISFADGTDQRELARALSRLRPGQSVCDFVSLVREEAAPLAAERLSRCCMSLELNHQRVKTAREMLIAELAAVRRELTDEARRHPMLALRLAVFAASVTKVDEACGKLAGAGAALQEWMTRSEKLGQQLPPPPQEVSLTLGPAPCCVWAAALSCLTRIEKLEVKIRASMEAACALLDEAVAGVQPLLVVDGLLPDLPDAAQPAVAALRATLATTRRISFRTKRLVVTAASAS